MDKLVDAVTASFIETIRWSVRAIQRDAVAAAARTGSSQTDILASNRSTGEGRSACLFKGDSEKVKKKEICVITEPADADLTHLDMTIDHPHRRPQLRPRRRRLSLLLLMKKRKENFLLFKRRKKKRPTFEVEEEEEEEEEEERRRRQDDDEATTKDAAEREEETTKKRRRDDESHGLTYSALLST
ncbi:hypothetical protein MGYG_08965 [Nannizzia gypsea CBS 118893]|uniref:Uncharacterized protein n=1 Tax=Arthroderma gypseum (strain ATCC MYA-4604 / CBS 118893) TaxID=535722 RepID=E4UQK9_ARTGP|nr:hypothetical protein MGYG_08965 [Nannizzia gypsea CBS 118893]EFQ99238.1 hypothetical protein MGYG_08965 [Nannizzia gypsea CBS 118893]